MVVIGGYVVLLRLVSQLVMWLVMWLWKTYIQSPL